MQERDKPPVGMNFVVRELFDHTTNKLNEEISIYVTDPPGAGGASHRYVIHSPGSRTFIKFQEGGIAENGVNGITQEALLAVVIDRLRSFQAGPFPSPQNAAALEHCAKALMELKNRTRDRVTRGVEGHEVA